MSDPDFLKIYVEGVEAWFPDPAEGWVIGRLQERKISDGRIEFTFFIQEGCKKGQNVVISELISSLEKDKESLLPPLHNPPALDGIDDLTMLSYLHEPAVLHNVKIRYLNNYIYTYSGIVLIAMNPFSEMDIYGPGMIMKYRNNNRDELDPHIFAVAEVSLKNLKITEKDQVIIVSGESGAGKTQSARYIMKYFASLNKDSPIRKLDSTTDFSSCYNVEDQILSTNPIMESFGNSKTVRNDNSSRFGKYTDIIFTKTDEKAGLRIRSAAINTYLLERSRVVYQPQNERGYHIFYQLCAGAPAAEKSELCLKHWSEFNYLKQGGVGTIDGVDDATMFAETTASLSTAKISFSTQWNIFRVCSGILHLGNINIRAIRDRMTIDDNDESFANVVRLLGLNKDNLKKWLLNKKIIMRSESIVKPLDLDQAIVARDSISKYLYSSLFSWLVNQICMGIQSEFSAGSEKLSKIGVLDIYGFEHFEENSFEQFCINYANERLQQEFNSHVFKLEQEEYINEKIEWSFIKFTDNKQCIDLIEGKYGIFDLLNEESKLQIGSDESLLIKFNESFLGKNKFYSKPKFGQNSFIVKHYAHDVTYRIDGFIKKNQDNVSREHLSVILESSFEFLKEIVNHASGVSDSAKTGNSAKVSPTLGEVFKKSLVSLLESMSKTEVHYIRCIKTNSKSLSFGFDPNMVLQQLRACGVLETIRISCEGYPTRATFSDFVDRYYMIPHSSLRCKNTKEFTIAIVKDVFADADKYQIGLTKVFFRAGQLAYLERLRSDKQMKSIRIIINQILIVVYRRKYLRQKAAAIKIQTIYRRYHAMKSFANMRRNLSATIIQTNFRRFIAMKKYEHAKRFIILAQTIYRTTSAQVLSRNLLLNRSVLLIQSVWRGVLERRNYTRTVNIITKLQTRFRTLIMVEETPALLKEARSVGKLKETQIKLESKIIEQARDIEALNTNIRGITAKAEHQEAVNRRLKEQYAKLEKESEKTIANIRQENEELQKTIGKLKDEIKICTELNTRYEETIRKKQEQIEGLTTNKGSSAVRTPSFMGMNAEKSLSFAEMPSKALHGNLSTSNSDFSLKKSQSSQKLGIDAYKLRMPSRGIQNKADIYRSSYYTDRLKVKSRFLIEEIKEQLIRSLETPRFNNNLEYINEIQESLIFFPSNVIGSICILMYHYDLIHPMRIFLEEIWESIGIKINKFKALEDYCFWISNTFNIMLLLNTIIQKNHGFDFHAEISQKNDGGVSSISDLVGKFILLIKDRILTSFMAHIKRILEPFIVPAVIESQPLPGYAVKTSESQYANFWKALTRSKDRESYTIDNLTRFLTSLLNTMIIYKVRSNTRYQIMMEVFRFISSVSFKEFLRKEGFWTWMRALQLEYNLGILTEWCKTYSMEGINCTLTCLDHAVKFILIDKLKSNSADIILDTCYSLSKNDIKRIAEIYIPTKESEVIPPKLIEEILSRDPTCYESDMRIDIDSENKNLLSGEKLVLYCPKPETPKWIVLQHTDPVINNSINIISQFENEVGKHELYKAASISSDFNMSEDKKRNLDGK